MNKRISLTTQAHRIIQQVITNGDFTIDATVGNGHDTLFLARQVGKQGYVFGFDIQQLAIESTRSLLETRHSMENIKLVHASHSKIKEYIPAQYHGNIKTIMFNLGYLPGSDKTVITQADSTLLALNNAIELLAPNGILTITAYPGHSGGDVETHKINQWCRQLNLQQYTLQLIYSSEKETAPRLFIIQRLT